LPLQAKSWLDFPDTRAFPGDLFLLVGGKRTGQKLLHLPTWMLDFLHLNMPSAPYHGTAGMHYEAATHNVAKTLLQFRCLSQVAR